MIAATSVAAKDWRGILPMHSTRADVEALLGPPPLGDGCLTFSKCALLYFLTEPRKFDEYGDIRLSDEKARLNNFGIQLMNTKETVGYIVVYAGRKARVAEAEFRGKRARNYLIKVRHIKPERLKAIDAGFREELTVELWILPAEAKPPASDPTVDPSQVEIVPAKKRRKS